MSEERKGELVLKPIYLPTPITRTLSLGADAVLVRLNLALEVRVHLNDRPASGLSLELAKVARAE